MVDPSDVLSMLRHYAPRSSFIRGEQLDAAEALQVCPYAETELLRHLHFLRLAFMSPHLD